MRVPYLDVDLVTFIESLPSKMKLRRTTHKYIHKKAAEKWLPGSIISRKKRGFETPVDQWLKKGLAGEVKSLLNEAGSASRRYFDLKSVNQLIDEHVAKQQNHLRQIYTLLSFELWHRTFFGHKGTLAGCLKAGDEGKSSLRYF
jgi:asparagine synthase (glutamine-hydrolysing)